MSSLVFSSFLVSSMKWLCHIDVLGFYPRDDKKNLKIDGTLIFTIDGYGLLFFFFSFMLNNLLIQRPSQVGYV
jgi:hypothetical protein